MTERERKYIISKNDYLALKKEFALDEILQTNYYFLQKNGDGFMTRIRLKNGKYQLTAKINGTNINGLFVSEELNADISKEEADFYIKNGISKQKIKEYLNLDIPFDLEYVGKLDTYRARINYKGITIELDKNLYAGVTDYELECELSEKEEGVLAEFLKTYFTSELTPSALPKFKRFLNSLN